MMWEILGIKPTKDIKEIKKAYAKLAKQYNPEEHPEEFKRIYDAYKQACAYAKNNNYVHVENLNHIDTEDDFTYLHESIDTDDNTLDYDFSAVNTNTFENDLDDNIDYKKLQQKLRMLVNNETLRDDINKWKAFFENENFQYFVFDKEFRMFASDMVFEVLFTPEIANLIADSFGRNSYTNIALKSPEQKGTVTILGLGGKVAASTPVKKFEYKQVHDYNPPNYSKYSSICIKIFGVCLSMFALLIIGLFIYAGLNM